MHIYTNSRTKKMWINIKCDKHMHTDIRRKKMLEKKLQRKAEKDQFLLILMENQKKCMQQVCFVM